MAMFCALLSFARLVFKPWWNLRRSKLPVKFLICLWSSIIIVTALMYCIICIYYDYVVWM